MSQRLFGPVVRLLLRAALLALVSRWVRRVVSVQQCWASVCFFSFLRMMYCRLLDLRYILRVCAVWLVLVARWIGGMVAAPHERASIRPFQYDLKREISTRELVCFAQVL